ncbi:Nitric oxide reductase activation protein, partial [Mycobacterium rhizamassiliense]
VTDPDRFRLLASFIAGRAVDVVPAAVGEPAHTDGRVIFVCASVSADELRRQVVAQSALIGAGSLAPRMVRQLRMRPALARRYLGLEGRRVLVELAQRLPLAATLSPDIRPPTATADESLDMAGSRSVVADPPAWFGVIKPTLLLRLSEHDARTTDRDLRFAGSADRPDEDADEPAERSTILKLFENPLMNSRMVSEFLRKLFGTSRAPGDNAAGAELSLGGLRRAHTLSRQARPVPTAIRVDDDSKPASALGVGAALHPEWDVFAGLYRPDWCRVFEYPLTAGLGNPAAEVAHDEVLRKRLSRIGLSPRVLRGRPDGDELDTDALIDFVVDLHSGHTPAPHVYTERRHLTRDLGVVILLDASGSVTDADPDGRAVHEHQRRAAATLAAALEDLGDRVAVYAFRSEGREAVHLLAIKTFAQRFGATSRGQLSELQPSGYTRLGAGIRGAAAILKTQAGTRHRLLLVLSDGFPYDHGYEGHYAESDTRKALEELRADGIAGLCLTLGSGAPAQALNRVFGPANHLSAATLAELSPRMDELFLLALRELAAPAP